MSSIIVESLGQITISYIYLLGLQLVFWPIAKSFFGNLPDAGWSVARFLGILVTSLTMWTLGHLGLAINSDIGMSVVVFSFLLAVLYKNRQIGFEVFKVEKQKIKVIVMAEYLFLAVFFVIAFVRGYLPQLDSLEKFMDYGFVNTYLRSSTLPTIDMWQAGEIINYYSFGHYWASVLIRFLQVTPAVGYNLALGFIGGVVASMTMTLVIAVAGVKSKFSLVGGLLASLMMVFGGNGHTIWYLLKNKSMEGYWYADATRFIHNTIHEFPSYSLIVSDLHGHLLGLPVVLLFLIVLYGFHKSRDLKSLFFLGGLVGVMGMTNTWDVLIYGLLMSIYYLYLIFKKETKILGALGHACLVLGTAIVITAPWWKTFVSISNGIRLVEVRSPLWQVGVLWCLLFIVAVATWVLAAKSENNQLIRATILTMLFLIILPEIIYFKDIYPDHPRANTMFKLTYQSFVLSVIIFGVGLTQLFHTAQKTTIKGIMFVCFVFVFGSSMMFPTLAYPAFYDNFKEYKGLNGEEWLKTSSPTKYEFLLFLRSSDKGGNIVEAVGDSYTNKNVISAYTGIPTIQGWRVHEWLWRGSYDPVAQRETEVKEIYEGKDMAMTSEILNKYNIDFILIGPDEAEMYLINHEKLMLLGEVTSFSEDYYIVAVNR